MLYQPVLASIRTALCDRIDEAAIRQQRRASAEVSLPSALLAAGLWLAAQGWRDAPCAGETFFAWGPAAYRRYLDRLTADRRDQELEVGRRVIFEGSAALPPLLERFTLRQDGFVSDAD